MRLRTASFGGEFFYKTRMDQMGNTLYCATDTKIDGLQLNNDRVFLAGLVGEHHAMAALCQSLGVPSLSGFQSYDPQMLADFIDDPKELAEAIAKAAPIQWFNPADAIPTLIALQTHYQTARYIQQRGRKPAGKREWEPVDRTDDLLAEIKDLETVLLRAVDAGAKFRIYVGF
jgi:hypothetical protein